MRSLEKRNWDDENELQNQILVSVIARTPSVETVPLLLELATTLDDPKLQFQIIKGFRRQAVYDESFNDIAFLLKI